MMGMLGLQVMGLTPAPQLEAVMLREETLGYDCQQHVVQKSQSMAIRRGA
jgi:hypothetical protein